MIKEKKKLTKYNYKKSSMKILMEYVRTVCLSILAAAIITTSLAIHARNEMIKDLFASQNMQKNLDKATALRLITQSNFLKDIHSKSYSVCMHVGEIYETAGDLKDAEIAYKIAIGKSPDNHYKAHLKYAEMLITQEKFTETEEFLDSVDDFLGRKLLKFKTRANIIMGDKYYSMGKFISAAKSYEKAQFYYNKFSKKDKIISESIKGRIINSYIEVADIMVKTGLNSEAVRYLKKAQKQDPENFEIKYKLAIVFSDLDPEISIEYLEKLLQEKPQDIDYGIFGRTLMKAANIADLDNRSTRAKYYRYKIHSIDMFINRKVVYKNDVDVTLHNFTLKKSFFRYPLKTSFNFLNMSNADIINLQADFVLKNGDKVVETITKTIANKTKPLLSNVFEPTVIDINFNQKVFTKRELENYKILIYIYKDEKYKTQVFEGKVPKRTLTTKNGIIQDDLDYFF